MRYASLIIVYFLTLFSFNAKGNNPVFDSANAAYAKGNFQKAAKLYEQLLSGEEVSADVYYNLGNAYYKDGKLGLAILNYERAKKLDPADEDILANLKLANQKTEDKIEAAPQLFLNEWKSSVIGLMSERSWSVFCILLFVLAAILLTVYVVSARTGLKKAGFYFGCLSLICGIIVFFIAKQRFNADTTTEMAVITSASVTVTASPDEQGMHLFVLHEGTLLSILEENGAWYEVKIANGNVGWVKEDVLVKI